MKPDLDHPKRSVCVWTQGEPEDARHWIPCFDYPNERSTAEMIITVDKPLSVVSNGTLESNRENSDGTSTYHWKMNSLLTPYLLSVVAADFAVYHDRLGSLPVDYYVLKDVDEATARRGPRQDAPNDRVFQPANRHALRLPQVCPGMSS